MRATAPVELARIASALILSVRRPTFEAVTADVELFRVGTRLELKARHGLELHDKLDQLQGDFANLAVQCRIVKLESNGSIGLSVFLLSANLAKTHGRGQCLDHLHLSKGIVI